MPTISRCSTRARSLSRRIWLIGDAAGDLGFGRRRRDPDAARRRADRGRRRSQPGDLGADPLHLRHHRPVEGRVLPACAILLVGGQHGVAAATARRRRALHQPAAVSHQRAQHLLSGAADRRAACVTRSASPPPGFLPSLVQQPRHRHLSARRHGADPAVAAGVAGGDARIRCASRSRPACRRSSTHEFTRRTGIRLLDGWGSTETNFVLGTTIERQQPGLMGPVFEGFDARVVDDHGQRRRRRHGRRAGRAGRRAAGVRPRILRRAGEDRRGLARWLVPHRRSRRAPGRRLFPVRRSAQGCDPAARREHFVLRGRAGAAQPCRRSPTRRRFRFALRLRRTR